MLNTTKGTQSRCFWQTPNIDLSAKDLNLHNFEKSEDYLFIFVDIYFKKIIVKPFYIYKIIICHSFMFVLCQAQKLFVQTSLSDDST